MSDYDRHLKTCMEEFERNVVHQVEREFEAARKLPGADVKIPFIDGKFNPHAPPEELAVLKQRVCRALCARKRFEFEAPLFCQPLPLCERERVQMNGNRNLRLGIVANYAMGLQSMDWHYERAVPFFDFIMQSAPPR